ncbi:MAG: CHC2 zinc finger domain-containing protein, partial [Clostridiales bacterium]|nr:CHC2 zinc finger domain-containing protein [Clostridiales bacterium]
MDIFTTVKAAVTVRQAAEHYGLQVSRNGMACCPVHDDRLPSMKLNERSFYCCGCGATGEVIDLVATVWG